jgi:predicted enzyme related to lactoylglutathione lyase
MQATLMENPVKDYDNFFLPVDDLERAKKFYRDTLGLPIKFDFPEMGMTAFKVGDQEPAIIAQDKTKHPQARPSILFVVEDVKKAYQELKGKGVKFLSEPYEIYTGMAVQFEDPFGNSLGLTDYTKQPKK